MTLTQQIITIGICIAGTMATRFLPFLIFRENRETPDFIQYLGKYLPPAVFGMLVIYCLKNVNILQGSHGLPEEPYAICCCCILYFRRQNRPILTYSLPGSRMR